MAPKAKLTAAVFQERYGDLVSEHFSQYTTARTLRVALSNHKPPIIVTDGMLKMWYHGFHSASRPPAVHWGSESNTKMVLLSKTLFLKVIPKWSYFQKQCF